MSRALRTNQMSPKSFDEAPLDDRTPVLRVRPADISPYALVCGDLERAKQIADQMEHAQLVGRGREYVTYTGEYRGRRVTASSHGVGAAGAAICFEELIRAGVKTIIRVGTCGSYLPHLRAGGLVIGTAAVRDEGITQEMVPLAFPAVADIDVTQALIRAARAHPNAPLAVGVVRTHGAFYSGVLPPTHSVWIQSGVVAVEMEYSALLIAASLRKIQAGGIFAVDCNPAEQADMTGYNPHREVVEQAKRTTIGIALEALLTLSQPPPA